MIFWLTFTIIVMKRLLTEFFMQEMELQKKALQIKLVHEDYKQKLNALKAQQAKVVQKLNRQQDVKNSPGSSFVRWVKDLFKG